MLDVQNLRVYFFRKEGAGIQVIKAVDGVDLPLYHGRTLCLLGEAGCGKSAACRAIAGAVFPPGSILSGRILFFSGGQPDDIVDLTCPNRHGWQDSITRIAQYLDPSPSARYAVGEQIIQVVPSHYPISRQEARGPLALIIDDPAAALADPNRDQILDRISVMQQESGMAVLCASRDLDLVARLADDVAVMYQGKIIEMANIHTILSGPKHPYTQALLKGSPAFSSNNGCNSVPPETHGVPQGCAFRSFCPKAMPVCGQSEPRLVTVGEHHDVCCFVYETLPVEPAEPFEQREANFDMWQLERLLMR